MNRTNEQKRKLQEVYDWFQPHYPFVKVEYSKNDKGIVTVTIRKEGKKEVFDPKKLTGNEK